MARTTKKAERAALEKKRRAIRRKLRGKRLAKGSGVKRATKTHPHRRAAATRGTR